MFEKVSVQLDCPIVSWEKFFVKEADNEYTAPIKIGKDNLEFKAQKNIIDGDYEGKNDKNNVTPVPTSFEMRNIMKTMRCYLDPHSNGKMNNKTDHMKQFDAKRDNAKKNIRLSSKTQ
ncbi:hypothetical protein TNCV_1281401 [Trichonephila clavipes]|nr:hypothetical protein TNCV_1281401 [Trichonephila clavipes]